MSDSGMLPPFATPRSPLEGYLEKAGWDRTGGVEDLYSVWTDADRGPNVEILVPLDEDRADYSTLYKRALSQLEQLLSRQALRRIVVQQEIETERGLAPTTWSRASTTPSGTVPWTTGEALHAAIARQLSSIARAAVTPMAQLGRSNIFVAKDFLDKTLLAPSGAGSYVVTALAPLHQPIYLTAPEEPKPDKPPRERKFVPATKILRTLDEALAAVSRGLEHETTQDAVETIKSAVDVGVSYELVRGLTEFLSGYEASVVVPSQLWTPGASPHEYAFKPKHTLMLAEVAQELAEETEATPSTVTGIITQLKHEPETDHTIHLFTTSRGPVRRVRVNLSEDDYQRALDAHREDSLVRISGTLAKDGKFWWIHEVQELYVMSDAEQELEEAPLRSQGAKSNSWEPPFDFDPPY